MDNDHSDWKQDGLEVNFNSATDKLNQAISIFFDTDNNVDIFHENRPPHPISSLRSSSKSVSSFFGMDFFDIGIAESVQLNPLEKSLPKLRAF